MRYLPPHDFHTLPTGTAGEATRGFTRVFTDAADYSTAQPENPSTDDIVAAGRSTATVAACRGERGDELGGDEFA